MDVDHGLRFDGVEDTRPAGHCAGMPVFKLAAGDQHERKLGIG